MINPLPDGGAVTHEIHDIKPAPNFSDTTLWRVKVRCSCGYLSPADLETHARAAWLAHKQDMEAQETQG